ncbi:MAG: TIGR00730 family Rossman fold protein [Clostridia bacterium]|nr:TIGR00730 family Rossman fold protein [Clostridia bacterium]
MNVCVYGASSNEIDKAYITATEELGEKLAREGHRLVYGGGGAGLMGAAARGMTRGGGYIVGVVPHFLRVDGILYEHCDEMVYTDTMRQRKQVMDERADAFIVTPGGIGTYEEFFEMYTLKQLGQHSKPIIIYNIGGYYDRLLEMLHFTVERGFMRQKSMTLFTVATTPEEALGQLTAPAETVDIKETKFV